MSKVKQTIRYKETDGLTYEVILEEVKRKRIYPREDLMRVLAAMIRKSSEEWQASQHLTTLRQDPEIILARKIVNWIEENPKKFELVLKEAKEAPRAKGDEEQS